MSLATIDMVIINLLTVMTLYVGYVLGKNMSIPIEQKVENSTLKKIKTYLESDEEAFDPSKED